MAGRSVAVVGGRVVPVTGPAIEGGTVLVTDGIIAEVGAGLAVPDGVPVIDATGSWVLPGFIDAHAHVGALQSRGHPTTRRGAARVGCGGRTLE